MIARNEELTIGRALESARIFCDQIIVVDTGSQDRTVEIARQAGAEIHFFPWIDDFSAARNHALSFCTCEWMLWLDADDVLPKSVQHAILNLKHSSLDDPSIHTVLASYHWSWDDAGHPVERFDRERLVRRSKFTLWQGAVHETLDCAPSGAICAEDVFVEHRPHADNVVRKQGRNLAIYEKNVDFRTASPHLIYQYGCELHWADRPADAACAFETYLVRVQGNDDEIGEQYLAHIKAGECRATIGDTDAALQHFQSAFSMDRGRAEAVCMEGELYHRLGFYAEAESKLCLAASIKIPKYDGRYIFPWFYGDRPRQALAKLRQEKKSVTRSRRPNR